MVTLLSLAQLSRTVDTVAKVPEVVPKDSRPQAAVSVSRACSVSIVNTIPNTKQQCSFNSDYNYTNAQTRWLDPFVRPDVTAYTAASSLPSID